jgi:hypothetical protein
MSTTQAVRVGGAATSTGFRRLVEKYFYFVMALAIGTVVVSGFSLTIGNRLFHPQVKMPTLLWVHGGVFFGWMGLFILQSALVRVRNVQLHKLLGWWFAAFAVAIPVLGIVITRVMSRFEIATLHYDATERAAFLPIPFQDMVAFTVIFGLAVLCRKRPEYHRRLMLVAACILTAAAWGRMAIPTNVPYISFYSGVDLLILLGVLRDLIVNRKVHAVYLWSIPPLVLLQLGAVAISVQRPAWWLSIGSAFIGKV